LTASVLRLKRRPPPKKKSTAQQRGEPKPSLKPTTPRRQNNQVSLLQTKPNRFILCIRLRKTLKFVDLSPHTALKTYSSASEYPFAVNKIRAFAHYAFVRNDSDA
jgi:hypothetical protein